MLSTIVRSHLHRSARCCRALFLASSNPSPPPPSAPRGLNPDLLRSLPVVVRSPSDDQEKNELRGEKIRLKADKEKLEQQLKAMDMPPAGYMPHSIVFQPAMFAPPGPTPATKASSSLAFPGVPMWRWLPPTVMGTNVLGNGCSGS
ncbi:hypothetical protein J5N97_004125 [Dioscorea zingiberensis]|uniref:Uncharacterized protein n=1 Tax=Dioscorea zingiberensis TaxID=325984 RepID=A0A9D5D6P5_9LILI|nr:hypothetical protein J5N97_004125 [Dioscorea zingiberensis]